ncbi:MAG: ATP-binding protein [Chloroflexota bacterium]
MCGTGPFPFRTLGGRLFVALAFIALISVGGLGYAAYRAERTALEEQLSRQLTSVADLKKEQIITWLKERQADTHLLAENILNQEHFTELLLPEIPDQRKAEFAAFLADNLIGLQRSRPGYSRIVFTDTAGRIIITTDPPSQGDFVTQDLAFKGTLAAPDGRFIQDIHFEPANGQIEMDFGQVMYAVDPVTKQEQANVVGVVLVTVNMAETIYPLIRAWPGMGETGETLLARAEGGSTLFLTDLRFDQDAALQLRLPADSPNAEPAHLSARGEEGIKQTLDYRGMPVLAAYRHIPGLNWGFVAKEDLDEALTPVTTLAARTGQLATGVLLVAAFLSAVLSRTLTRPLAHLVQATRTVAAGDLTAEIRVNRRDEIGYLADSFRAMVASLEQRQTQLQAVMETLEQRVAQRTQELAEANERLKELDKLKSKFVSDVSHELRTPVANLHLYLDLLGRARPDKHPQYLAVLRHEAGRLRQLIEDILSLSRLETGKTTIQFAPVDLNTIVSQVVTAHLPRAQAAGLQLRFEPAANIPLVTAERNQLAQVATNLIANAINYTPAGSVQVATGIDRDQQRVYLEVRDTGMGIEPEDMPHLFERFYRGHHTNQMDIPGTGLGLGIVKEILDIHQATIQVESRLNAGTVFRVNLPLIPDNAPVTS